MSVIWLFCLLALVYSHPNPDDGGRLPRTPAFASSGSSANSGAFASAGAGAFSTAGTSVFQGPGGSGSFNAMAGIRNMNEPSANLANVDNGASTYAPNYDYKTYSKPDQVGSNGNTDKPTIPANNEGNQFGNSGFDTGAFSGTAGGFAGPAGAFAGSGAFPNNFGNDGLHNRNPFDQPFPDFSALMKQHFASVADSFRKHMEITRGFGIPDSNINGAAAFGQFGPQGGFGAAKVYPPAKKGAEFRSGLGDDDDDIDVDDDIETGPVSSSQGKFPPPTGKFYEISSFSSSGQTDDNGKKTSFKNSSVRVNDNGKVTTYTAHDP